MDGICFHHKNAIIAVYRECWKTIVCNFNKRENRFALPSDTAWPMMFNDLVVLSSYKPASREI